MPTTTVPTPPPSQDPTSQPHPPSYLYPYASSPDIIRSNQKDTYFTSTLHTSLSTILRRLYGSRFSHTYDAEARTFTELLYLGLTTFIGNRTLGEEYCDIHQVEGATGKLPAVGRRAGYIISVVLVPYGLGKLLPALRARTRLRLEKNLASRRDKHAASYRIQAYLLEHLASITSPSPFYALSLAVFYFTGSYYHLSKRITGLRYIFSKRLSPPEERVGYEVLGVLLVLQMVVQGWLHVQSTVTTDLPTDGASAVLDDGVEVGLGSQASAEENQTLPVAGNAADGRSRIAVATHTPLLSSSVPRYDLSDPSVLGWLQPQQQRKCTLCLEPTKDPSVTTCGHVFCWTCILDWVREKPECPLCRQHVLGQHVLPLRG